MPVDYLVTFIGHLDKAKARLAGLPDEIYDIQTFLNVASKDALVDAVKRWTMQYIQVQGMGVSLKPHDMIDPSILEANRMFVPFHMITHITAEPKRLGAETPTVDEDSLETYMRSGKNIVKN